MIPEGWVQSEVGDHVDLLSGFPFKSSDYSDNPDDIRLLRGDNIGQGRLRWRDAKRWDRMQYDGLAKYQLRLGDFVIAMDRTWVTGGLKVAEVKEHDIPSLLLQRVSRLRAHPSLDQRLLRFFINGYRFEQYVKSVQTETAVPHISAKQIKEYPILIPPLPEQRKIAEILSVWDAAIEKTEALLATARTQKRALMQQLLTGRRRFPEFEGQPWKEVRLGDVAKVTMGSSPKSSAYNQDSIGLPLIQGNADVKDGRTAPRSFTSEITTTCRVGDILLSVRAPVGTVAVSSHDACVGRGAAVIQPLAGTNWTWLKHLMHFLEDKWAAVSQGSTFDAVNSRDIKGFKISAPLSDVEQSRIGEVLEIAECETQDLRAQVTKLRAEKKALMQQLLTGKRRVVL